MGKEKVTSKTELEFITEVANDCVANLSNEDREYLISNPRAIDYHFTYCLYIRNHYIHNRDFSDVDFFAEPDRLSSEIIKMIFSIIITEYEYGNQFIGNLFDNKKFIQLRKEYMSVHGHYPADIVEKYKASISFEPEMSWLEIRTFQNAEREEAIGAYMRNCEKCSEHIEKLLQELADKI